ncbi:hypothetical protein GUITHDRAFT_118602 [Guillardia theta CCMP2712]|uniref:Uncharacterized protein n=1 Tax=Guillardia theta (strain CCMP2712) TaxID=905079 RepID=L1IG67_GUITC|nr:hypothetical protein GUITHDRAFT_118602 [Guillardia theta CCMP2712]EKX35256.1 hypothetical protein GUITHDRAFT_118602 [Guillardia theta CCMP2712]|eukprot:XP_005822236.1 hypothetical protein GUITHDRAFT_118602 [Guillardia theta CCMP2712]
MESEGKLGQEGVGKRRRGQQGRKGRVWDKEEDEDKVKDKDKDKDKEDERDEEEGEDEDEDEELLTFSSAMGQIGNMVTTLGLNLQRYAHTKAEASVSYTQSRLWWIGVSLMITGEMGNFAAYGFAPATLVAPMGAFSVIANAAYATM